MRAKLTAKRFSIVAVLLFAPAAFGFESLYTRTEPGATEVKSIPPLLAVSATGPGTVFDSIGVPFKKLYRYIRANNVAMTVPIEAETSTNRMRILPSRSLRRADLKPAADVEIVEVPERQVVAVGLRGSYSVGLYERGVKDLRAWLAGQGEWIAAGEPYNVFWDPIWVPGFMKRSEVHIPVVRAEAKEAVR
ncbi:MAG: SOUL heme-binding protein [Verrucomicrobia bacterium ADurb.Bin345]|nr:MAG: SOUL heme-binding protein [Verrucomicrobia bacterium ADurb.Bin345]